MSKNLERLVEFLGKYGIGLSYPWDFKKQWLTSVECGIIKTNWPNRTCY